MSIPNESSDIVLHRVYDAPVSAVWDAWTDPAKVAQWWGPRGFTLTHHSKDLRPGGHWRYTMHGPDGTDYPNVTTYHEVEVGARLVYDHGATDDTPPVFRVTATFEEVGGKTHLHLTMTLPTPEAAAQTRKFVKAAGGNATWDRLGEFLEADATGRQIFVINREFAAPLETVFAMWTTPEHLARWLPPTGFRMEFIRADIRSGGESFYLMTNDATVKMYGRARYLDVTRPERVVYTQQFCDANENVTRHPMAPTWPETMHTTVTFSAEAPDRTRVTVRWDVVGDVTAEELATFVGGRTGMTGGWTGSFDKLDAVLAASAP